jgi:antagonist of KipI
MSLRFLSGGLLTTVQDLGRKGYARHGINRSGVMDTCAARLINILLGNDENEAVVEMHFPAPQILFEQNAYIALGGANFSPLVENKSVENWKILHVKKNSLLRFKEKLGGERAYLAVRGGFALEKWLGSYSTNLKAHVGGLCGNALAKSDLLNKNSECENSNEKFQNKISFSLIPKYVDSPRVRVLAGKEMDRLTILSQAKFLNNSFVISRNSDRMGFRLAGESLELAEKIELVSSAVNFGTIQLLPDGQMIILMADHQTTGGYPCLGHIISRDLPLVAQLGAGDKVSFQIVSIAEAEELTLEFEKELNWLKVGSRLRWGI